MAATTEESRSKNREARFLASRSSRTAERTAARQALCDESAASTKSRDEFWAAFRDRCADLQERIDALGVDESVAGGVSETPAPLQYVTAAQRNEGKAKLDSITNDLAALRRICGLGSSETASIMAPSDAGEDEIIDRDIISSLPPGDLRFLAGDLLRISNRITEAREVLCPREVFTFKRYRAAVAERQQRRGYLRQEKNDQSGVNKSVGPKHQSEFSLPCAVEDEEGKYGMVVRNKTDSLITFDIDGIIQFSQLSNDDKVNTTEDVVRRPTNSSKATSVILRSLKNCKVVLKGIYQSVHLVDLEASEVSVTRPIAGPAHISLCRNSIFRAACHQFRMHDSTGFTCHIHVGAGPIIEGCKDIIFFGDYYRLFPENECTSEASENKFREVKDFNWLRTMIKSPNFEVRESSEKASYEQHESAAPDSKKAAHCIDGQINDAANDFNTTMQIDDSSDEDEL
mmetsp:Transcript_48163/g.145497  ORF Transcript_48163/g.145497 Transcript_48163/m.145497 type:complete len:458 (-) Transcript_48163:155-1528(-)